MHKCINKRLTFFYSNDLFFKLNKANSLMPYGIFNRTDCKKNDF